MVTESPSKMALYMVEGSILPFPYSFQCSHNFAFFNVKNLTDMERVFLL